VRCSFFCTVSICFSIAGGREMVMVSVVLMFNFGVTY
jgi:hypothetical protein